MKNTQIVCDFKMDDLGWVVIFFCITSSKILCILSDFFGCMGCSVFK